MCGNDSGYRKLITLTAAGLRADAVDKHPTPTYYFPIMDSERVQRRIELPLDQAEEAMDRLD